MKSIENRNNKKSIKQLITICSEIFIFITAAVYILFIRISIPFYPTQRFISESIVYQILIFLGVMLIQEFVYHFVSEKIFTCNNKLRMFFSYLSWILIGLFLFASGNILISIAARPNTLNGIYFPNIMNIYFNNYVMLYIISAITGIFFFLGRKKNA